MSVAPPGGREPARGGGRAAEVVLPLMVVALVAWALVALGRADEGAIDGYGLLPALPVALFVAVAVAVISFFVLLHRGAPAALLVLHVVAVFLLFDAAPALVSNEPRFPVAWLHTGFVDQIVVHGTVLEDYDARMSWPGFFAAAALAVSASGAENALHLLRWAPFVLHLLYLAPLLLLARALVADRRARWTGVLLFYLGDWVGQTYFGPQGLVYLVFLTVVAVLVSWFRPATLRSSPLVQVLRRIPWREPREQPLPLHGQLALLGLVVVLTLGLVVSHQLTPAALILQSGALLLLGRLRLVTYPVLAALLMGGYVAFGATDYWIGHRAQLVGSGSGEAVAANLGDRVMGSPEHLEILRVRLAVTGLLFSVAAVGVLRQLRERRVSLTLVALGIGTLPIPLLQPYGGEALLRVVLYSLPFAALLAGVAFFGSTYRSRQVAAAATFCLLLAAAFPLARYGNESFERVRTGEVAAIRALYDAAPEGSTFVVMTSNVPWRTERLRGFDYVALADDVDKSDPFAVLDALDELPMPVYVLLTEGQAAWGREVLGLRESWLDDIAEALHQEPDYLRIKNTPEARVFVREERPLPPPSGLVGPRAAG